MLLDALRRAWGLLQSKPVEPWAADEGAFYEHFGYLYPDFAELVSALDQANNQLYEKTLEVNPEAAVAWVLWRGLS